MPAEDTKSLIAKVKGLVERKGLKHDKSGKGYYTGYGDDLYDWELYFDCIALAYFGAETYTTSGTHHFLSNERENGFIARHINMTARPNFWRHFEDEEHCKPFLCQSSLIVSRMGGDASWLGREEFRKLRRYVDHWLLAWDEDGSGLSEWSSAPHSGADTQIERVGVWGSRFCEGVDLNCYLYRECLAAMRLAEALELKDDAAHFYEQAEKKKSKIQELLWDDREGFFYDRDIRTGKPIRVKSAATFIPLWAGIATKEQARALVERHLKNPGEFWTPYPVSSYARSEPSYTQFYEPSPGADRSYVLNPGHANWCGGMWPHWNYFIAHGLKDYGYGEEALHIAERFYRVVAADPGLYEWYDAEAGKGQGLHPFCAGATVLGAILHTELRLDFDPTRAEKVQEKLDFTRIRQEVGIEGTLFKTSP